MPQMLLQKGNDPIWQKTKGETSNKEPIQNWEGNDNGAFPPDLSGADGPNHFVKMINSEYIIYDKTGTILAVLNALSSVVDSDDRDPIVTYDRFEDRWLLSVFGIGNQLAVAIYTTPDYDCNDYTFIGNWSRYRNWWLSWCTSCACRFRLTSSR